MQYGASALTAVSALLYMCVGRYRPQKNRHVHTEGIKLGIIKKEYLIFQDNIDENN
jgi:hypothetical protein